MSEERHWEKGLEVRNWDWKYEFEIPTEKSVMESEEDIHTIYVIGPYMRKVK
jgi:hypothetical protein